MDTPFLDKLNQIVLSHLDDENFGVSQLASEIGLSRSQTLRKIKSLTNKSVNQFIKEIRLKEAAKLILNSDLNASEVSYKVGFSSPSYFNKCFSKYYGVTPGEYKENPRPITPSKQAYSSRIKKLQIGFYIIGASLLLFVSFSIVNNITNPQKLSVAVLYFDDHSPDSDINMQKYSSAVTEAITSKISNIKKLFVTSRTSVKQYRNSDKTIPEIAKALGVDKIIEGSSLKFNDSILITVQLIDKLDGHKWSKTFSDSYENSFKLLNEVAISIAQQLEIDLNPEEKKRINFIPTENMEAFQFYSEGISYLDLVNVENLDVFRFVLPGGYKNLKKSDTLFREALALDPNFAEALAELAFVLQLRWEKASKKRTVVKFREIDSLVNLSLKIDENTTKAYITKGLRQGYNLGDWEKAGFYFKKALDLKPNDAVNQLYYALYFARKAEPDYKKALEHINSAQKLNPHAATINYDKIIYLLNNNKFTEAEEFYKQKNSFFPEKLKSKIQIKLLKGKVKKLCLEKKTGQKL